ncbi:MAG: hypothetical protein K2X82_08905 [Gemmataceae bacterium]|nr:hypothetical protein [Gemmataceae bacterium]
MTPDKAPLWRPFVVAGVVLGLGLARQRVDQTRPWPVYALLACVVSVCCVTVWGVQRLLGRRWHGVTEGVAVLLLTVGVLAAVPRVVGWLRPEPEAASPPDVNEGMAQLADKAVRRAADEYAADLDYSPESVERVEAVLGRLHARHAAGDLPAEQAGREAAVWGAYVGEVIRRLKGGHWEADHAAAGPGSVAICYDGGQSFPVGWCYKRIVNGDEDNVWHKFRYFALGERGGGAVVDTAPKP